MSLFNLVILTKSVKSEQEFPNNDPEELLLENQLKNIYEEIHFISKLSEIFKGKNHSV